MRRAGTFYSIFVFGALCFIVGYMIGSKVIRNKMVQSEQSAQCESPKKNYTPVELPPDPIDAFLSNPSAKSEGLDEK